MDDDVLVNNYHDDANDSCGLTKNEVIKLLYNQDNSIALIAPEKFKSPIWERFRVVYYKGKRRRQHISRSVIREWLVRDVIDDCAFCSLGSLFLLRCFFPFSNTFAITVSFSSRLHFTRK